jgi:hypothetical protein
VARMTRHSGVGFPNGAADVAAVLALPSPDLLMLNSEHWHHDRAVDEGKRVLWRAVAREGKRPAELNYRADRYVAEIMRHTDDVREPIRAFIGWNELDLNYERGDGDNDFDDLDARYERVGAFLGRVVTRLRAALPTGCDLHFGAWTPDHGALDHLAAWREAADACDVVDFHAYESLDRIKAAYAAYRSAFPGRRLALTEWHCRGDFAEERRVLGWLAAAMRDDKLFEAAYFFIYRWHGAASWWSDDWDIEHNAERRALFMDPPTDVEQEGEAPVPNYRAMARWAAAAAGIDAWLFERQIDQESGYRQDVIDCRTDSSAGARGIAQIVPRWHPGVDPCNPEEALNYAAALMAGYLERHGGDWALALSCYNAGSGATEAGLAGTLDGWPYAETVNYVSSILGIPQDEARRRLAPQAAPPKVRYNVAEPTIAQDDDWSCAPTSLRWALKSLGRDPAEAWIEATMIDEGVVSMRSGLLDASGAGLADFVRRQYGEFGYTASANSGVPFDYVATMAGTRPILIGGRAWNHWSGVRSYSPARDVLLLANPADGYGGVRQEMTRQQFGALGPFSAVDISHPDLDATEPAPPSEPQPPAADPRDGVIAGLRTALAHVCDVVVGKAAQGARMADEAEQEAVKIREQFLGPRAS